MSGGSLCSIIIVIVVVNNDVGDDDIWDVSKTYWKIWTYKMRECIVFN